MQTRGGAAGTPGDGEGAGIGDVDAQDVGGTEDDAGAFLRAVELEAVDRAKPVTEGGGEGAGTGGGTDDGEVGEGEAIGASAGLAGADDDVEGEVFHGGVEDFLDGLAEAVDFVDEENFGGVEAAEGGGEVAGAFEGGAGGDAEASAHFVGDNVGEGGFAQARRTAEEDVIDGFVALPGGLDHESEGALDAFLTDEFIVREVAGAKGTVQPLIARGGLRGDDAFGHAGRPREPRSRRAAAIRASTDMGSPTVWLRATVASVRV